MNKLGYGLLVACLKLNHLLGVNITFMGETLNLDLVEAVNRKEYFKDH